MKKTMLSLSKITSAVINRIEQLIIKTIAPKTVDKDIANLLDFEAHLTDLDTISVNDFAHSVSTIECALISILYMSSFLIIFSRKNISSPDNVL